MHFMLEEISSEPAIIEDYKSKDFPDLNEIVETLSESDVVYAIGNGTSYHAALYLSVLLNRKGVSCLPMFSTETREWIRSTKSGATTVVFSQSGESVDTMDSVGELKKSNSKIIGITNARQSRLYRASDLRIFTDVGKEESVPATKSHLSQLLTALKISLSGRDEEYSSLLDDVLMGARSLVMQKEKVRDLSESIGDNKVFLGSGLLYPIALETSLKLLETSNEVSYAFPVKEFLHGPKQILDREWSVLMLSEDHKVARDLERYAGLVVNVADYLKENFEIQTDDEVTRSVTALIFGQLLSYYTSVYHGLNPDRPSKLSKVVK